ncbi:flagellar hook-basal body protein [Halobacillus litoralis]|uniref:flagellar hook-basal body protein n=1 Tax=Halobacillus litoralis TaxID=45668 RepID=UPI001CFDA67D|nr:flagellar hook-basal body protein [Halobacillus litoralis]
MNRSMIQSAVTMGQLQTKMDLIGNNLSNSQTTGYKTRNADFSSLLSQQIDNQTNEALEVGRSTPAGIRVGAGAKLGSTKVDLSEGSLKGTGRELDVALLNKNHLFELNVPTVEGIESHYTRAGNFYLNPINGGQVMLTDANGYPVAGEDGGNIEFEDDFNEITIRENGAVVVERGDQQVVEGRLNVIEATRPHLLSFVGENRFRIPNGSDPANLIEEVQAENVTMQSGTLEESNVDTAHQMTELMMAQRAYQFNAKSITTGDQMMGLVNQLRS